MALQLPNLNTTNENMATTALKYLHDAVGFVTEAAAEGSFSQSSFISRKICRYFGEGRKLGKERVNAIYKGHSLCRYRCMLSYNSFPELFYIF